MHSLGHAEDPFASLAAGELTFSDSELAMQNRWRSEASYSLEGHLLVASPHWQHELFGRSVCLLVQHGSQGAIGFFLNRSLPIDALALWQQLAGESRVNARAAVNFGGPQSGPVVALHDRRELAEFTTAEGVYLAAQIQYLRQLVTASSTESRVKIIVGQADWQAGKLDEQFAEGKWLPLPISASLVFEEESQMWGRAIREIGNRYVVSITGSPGQPRNILAN